MDYQTDELKALRIASAMDVIESLNYSDNPLKARCMTYCTAYGVDKNKRKELVGDSKRFAELLQKSDCVACAIGALFLSLVKLDDKYDFVRDGGNNGYGFSPSLLRLKDRLRETFSHEQLNMIESAFECTYIGDCSEKILQASKFGDGYDSPKEILEAIMKNIIENDGEFIP